MGTRSFTGVRIGGTDKLSYNQYDGYPDGVGQQVLDELHGLFEAVGYEKGLAELRDLAERLRLVPEHGNPTPQDFDTYNEVHDPSVSTGGDWYALLREDQGFILQRLRRGVATGEVGCGAIGMGTEYAYIVNLDEGTLEAYRSVYPRTTTGEGRYAHHPDGLKLYATMKLSELPAEMPSPKSDEDEEAA